MGTRRPPPKGALALVTGAGSGIGAATAAALAEAGMRVICAGRTLASIEATAERIGIRARALELDVDDLASVETLHDRLPADWRDIEVLVNSAGHDVGGRRPFHEGDADQWAAIIETNVIGLVWVTRAVIDGMRARGRGHVVNIGSTSGLNPYAGGTLYAASKHAVHGFSESLRLDYRGTGIRVTEILPGMVRTGFAIARRGGDREAGERFYDEYGECLTAEDVARTVVFAIEQPEHVVISQLVVVPRKQG